MPNLTLLFVIISALGLCCGEEDGLHWTNKLVNKNKTYSHRVVGGEDAKNGEFPYQVEITKERSHYCGGVIIGENVVLTAAHCMNQEHMLLYEVLAGITNRYEHGEHVQKSKLKKIISHPDYSGSVATDDIAVLILETPFKLNKYVQKAHLPEKNQVFEGDVMLTGWGNTVRGEGYPEIPDILQKAKVPIISYKECYDFYPSTSLHKEKNICTGATPNDLSACSGDSGGPLAKTENDITYIVGLVSWGKIPCGTGYPSVYTRVSYYTDFIKENSQ